jgi:hypothetical protein
VNNEPSILHAKLDAEAKALRGQMASVHAERKKIRAAVRELQARRRSLADRLDMIMRVTAEAVPADSPIQAPIVQCVSHHDWIIEVLQANPGGLTKEQLIEYIGARIQTKSRSRPKAVVDVLGRLTRAGLIQRLNGVYRSNPDPTGRAKPE